MSSEPLLSIPNAGDSKEPCHFDFHPANGTGDFILPQLSVVRKQELVAATQARAWSRTWIGKWGRRKVVDPFVLILRRGLEPKVLSLSAAVGVTIGLFPLCGVTMILCAISAVVMRSKCHVPTLMLGNFVASVFELGLFIPLLRVGELVTGGEHLSIPSLVGLWDALRVHRPSQALVFGMLHAVIGWSIVAPFSVVILYAGFFPIFHYLTHKFGPNKIVWHTALGSHHGAPSSVHNSTSIARPPSELHSTITVAEM